LFTAITKFKLKAKERQYTYIKIATLLHVVKLAGINILLPLTGKKERKEKICCEHCRIKLSDGQKTHKTEADISREEYGLMFLTSVCISTGFYS
jgi:hypothetical protein